MIPSKLLRSSPPSRQPVAARIFALAALVGVTLAVAAPPPDVSVNSTSQSSSEVGVVPSLLGPVPEASMVNAGTHQVFAINDLGMHCGDLDTRVSSILPPFQAMVVQVVLKGKTPALLGPGDVDVFYSAASSLNDPILTQTSPDPFSGLLANGDVYKTNYWSVIPAYDPFYPPGILCTPGATDPAGCVVPRDQGLVVPNVENLYIGPDGLVNSGDEFLSAVQHGMPGISDPYRANTLQIVQEYFTDKPFFVNFPFGYVADGLKIFEGAGIPFAAFDDFGRENAYPLVRVQAKTKAGETLSTLDTVLPISGEANCGNCHASTTDVPVSTDTPNAGYATQKLVTAGLPVATAFDNDPEYGNVPGKVSVEYATDINVLRLHDFKHGRKYVNSAGAKTACTISAASPNGNANCLTNKALVQNKPVVCQVCHYTPALDLAQFGPLGGDPNTVDVNANGRVQRAHRSNSSVMHLFHGNLKRNSKLLFPTMPAPVQDANGVITNQAQREKVRDDTCYQCHPGKNVQCQRGAMNTGGVLCNDCHGNMTQIGDDFSRDVRPSKPNNFKLGLGNFYDPASAQKRVPWANEPGCGSCHTGDANSNLSASANIVVNKKDVYGNADNLRLLRAFLSNDKKATPIVPGNKRFAENTIPASFNGFANPGAGNPRLYRVSAGHGSVACEGCHGSTHAEWPNGNPLANDNVTATQLQGHTGTVTECSTCHGNSAFDIDDFKGKFDANGLMKGPHGMHPVGDSMWNDKHKEVYEDGKTPAGTCQACHGLNLEGTVLARMATDRTLECKETNIPGCVNTAQGKRITLLKGTPVSCTNCHEDPRFED